MENIDLINILRDTISSYSYLNDSKDFIYEVIHNNITQPGLKEALVQFAGELNNKETWTINEIEFVNFIFNEIIPDVLIKNIII